MVALIGAFSGFHLAQQRQFGFVQRQAPLGAHGTMAARVASNSLRARSSTWLASCWASSANGPRQLHQAAVRQGGWQCAPLGCG